MQNREALSEQERHALEVARSMIENGIPVFAAPPCPDDCAQPGHAKLEYHPPKAWQKIRPSMKQLERWKPGWGLAAIGGHRVDFLDEDPRHGGRETVNGLKAAGMWPREFGRTRTPGGGHHYVILPIGEARAEGIAPGLDYQGGQPDGEGRAFVWLPPTVRRSKDPERLGELVAYEWEEEIYFPALEECRENDNGEEIRELIHASRAGTKSPVQDPPAKSDEDRDEGDEAQLSQGDDVVRDSLMDGPDPAEFRGAAGAAKPSREFTQASAEEFLRPHLAALRKAPIGRIEELANKAAVALSHFVPEFWDPEVAYAILVDNLSHTAYDPDGPYASWDASKFLPVLDGRRASRDPWKAKRLADVPEALREEHVTEATGDAVDALLAEMLTPRQIAQKPPPRALIKGLLNVDSESWLIGAPGSKKSFVALDMAAHVAAGTPWMGRRVTQGPVVIIAAEGSGGLGPRVAAWEKRNGPMSDNIHILPRPVQAADRGAWAVLVEACRRLKAVMVIADTQARVTVGLEENSATEMGIYIEAVRAIREATGACVLSVHHTGRSGGDARGSSAIDGAQHTELKVAAEKGSLRGALVSEKQKDMELAPDIPLIFEIIDSGLIDEDGETVTSLVLCEADEWREASGQEERPEVEHWEQHHAATQVQIIKVLRDQGGSVGVTKAEARTGAIERFHAGDAKSLPRTTFNSAWTKVLEKRTAEGDPIAVNLGGQKWGLDPVAFAVLAEEGPEGEA